MIKINAFSLQWYDVFSSYYGLIGYLSHELRPFFPPLTKDWFSENVTVMIRKPPWDGSFDTLTGRSYELSVYEQKNTKNVKCPKHLAVFYKSWHFLMDDVCDVLFSGVEGL